MRKPQRRSIGSSTPSGSLGACWKTSSLRIELQAPVARGAADFRHHVVVGTAGRLEDVERMVRAFEPMHPPGAAFQRPVHQAPLAERVAGAVDAKDRNLDPGQMSIA